MRRGLLWLVVPEARRFVIRLLCLVKALCWVISQNRETHGLICKRQNPESNIAL